MSRKGSPQNPMALLQPPTDSQEGKAKNDVGPSKQAALRSVLNLVVDLFLVGKLQYHF